MSIPAVTDPRAEPVVEVVKALIAAVGHGRLYGLQHRETHRSLEVFAQIVNGVSQSEGPLCLQAFLDGLRWRGIRLTDDRDDERGIGRHLHREGIASLTFHPGVDVDEVRRLVTALQANLSLPQYEEETLESLLWQAELNRIEFQAVTALMEAEALSGREGRETSEDVEQVLRQVLELRLNRTPGNLRNFEAAVGEDQVHRALDEHQISVEAPRQQGRSQEQEEWRILLDRQEEDFEAIERMLIQLDEERDSQLLARLLMLLLRVAVARRGEIKPREAFGLARKTVEAIYQLADPVGIMEVLNDARRLIKDLSADDTQARKVLNQFYRLALPPMRVANTLSSLSPTDPRERQALQRLLAMLPTDSLLTILERTGREPDQEKAAVFIEAMAAAVGKRILEYFRDNSRLPVEQLVPIIGICRHVGGEAERQRRRELVGRSSPPVVVALLEWFSDDLPDADLGLVIECLRSRHTAIRRAAIETLGARRPRAAARMLRAKIASDGFTQMAAEHQRAWCVAYGRVDRDAAVDVLTELLHRKLPLFNKKEALPILEAAASGLAATGSPLGLRLLRKEAGNPRSARGAACAQALAQIRDQHGR